MENEKLICPRCKVNTIVRTKPRGMLPICDQCKEIHHQASLLKQREKRKAGIWESHKSRETGLRYGTILRTCNYCKTESFNCILKNKIPVCKDCEPFHLRKIIERRPVNKKKVYWKDPVKARQLRNLRPRKLDRQWYEEQPKVCGICGTENPGTRGSWRIDHDHNCCKKGCPNCIRGLLCNNCNLALGLFKDNIESLKAAIVWLEKSKLE